MADPRRLRRVRICRLQWVDILGTFILAMWVVVPCSRALTPEGLALLDFKRNVQDPGRVLQSWNETDSTPCKWRGIGCKQNSSQVMTLNLPRSRLSGTISPQLGELTQLRRLGLHFNNLSGDIPSSLGNLTHLRSLYLQNNSLTSVLPEALCLLQYNLRILDVANNKLHRAIPLDFSKMNKLVFLNLSNNELSGTVPDGAMLRFPPSSFAGNFLCGSSLLGLPSCSAEWSNIYTGSHWSLWKILLISVGGFLFFKLVIGVLLLRRWLLADKKREISLGKGGKLVMFKGGVEVPTSREMLRAVRKIKKKDVVGEGGYGVVYKMVLKNHGITFAVKKLKQCLEAARGFENELETLGEIKHCNLVKLRGYCVAPLSRLLIYDFIPNGTLDQLLHPCTEEDKKNATVEWYTRVKIALGVARALAYLHHSCEPRIIHRDVSSTNILLDGEFEAHLSDFGLAKLLETNDTHVTATAGGTFGYVAPEQASTGQATVKTDVYSYGVILLELLSGRRPTETSFSEEHVNLAGCVRKLRERSLEFEIVDKNLRETIPHRELAVLVEIACTCVSLAPEQRPCMDRIVQLLESLPEYDNTTPSSYSLSTAPSTKKHSMDYNDIHSGFNKDPDFLDIAHLPGFRRDGHNYVLDTDFSDGIRPESFGAGRV